MKHRSFIHVLLFASLCIGQIATNAHIIGHLLNPANLHESSHEHHQHVSFTDLREQQFHDTHADTTDPASLMADCGIYHAYAGMSAISVKSGAELTLQYRCVPGPDTTHTIITTHSTDWQPIRGPPRIS